MVDIVEQNCDLEVDLDINLTEIQVCDSIVKSYNMFTNIVDYQTFKEINALEFVKHHSQPLKKFEGLPPLHRYGV